MKNHQHKTEKEKAIEARHSHPFKFIGCDIQSSIDPSLRFNLIDVGKVPCPCRASESTVYRITTPCNILGYAELAWCNAQYEID